MWVLLNLAVWAVVLFVVFLLIWITWSVLAVVFARRKVRWVLMGVPGSMLVVALLVVSAWVYFTRPSVMFENEFGFAVPADTTIVSASSFALGDSGSAYFHLKTSPKTASLLMAGYGSAAGYVDRSAERPSWCSPESVGQSFITCEQRISYTSPASGPATPRKFESETRRIWYDPLTGDLWYEYSGVD